MRGPGMTLGRMPVFVWIMLTVSAMTLFILPPLSAAQIMLMLDRYLGAHFFDTQAGGSAVMWQHFFWFFGHPEVYVLMLPGFGFVSEIIPVFSRKVIFGYRPWWRRRCPSARRLSIWAHHMFAVGMGAAAATRSSPCPPCSIAVPTGIKIFNWLGTMYGGKIRFQTPMLFCCAFLFQFLIAGLTGIMLSVAPVRLAADRLLLRGGALPLRAGGRACSSRIFAADLLLVPQGDRPDALRAPRPLALLAAS